QRGLPWLPADLSAQLPRFSPSCPSGSLPARLASRRGRAADERPPTQQQQATLYAGYDEDLSENPFFQRLKTEAASIYNSAAAKGWLVAVPRLGSYAEDSPPDESEFLSHVLVAVSADDGSYKTLKNQRVQQVGRALRTGEGFEHAKEVLILFDELFVLDSGNRHRVLCLSEPLTGPPAEPPPGGRRAGAVGSGPVFTLSSLEDCAELLFGRASRETRLRHRLDSAIAAFCHGLGCTDFENVDQCVRAVQDLYSSCLHSALKDSRIREQVKANSVFLDCVKLALETLVLSRAHSRLFPALRDLCESRDAAINRAARRSLYGLSPASLGIRPAMADNLPKARRQLSALAGLTTPLGKCSCLRRAVLALAGETGSSASASASASSAPMTADDLLPCLVFLLARSEQPDWAAHMAYMRRFRFARPRNHDEFDYFLSSLEAAMDYLATTWASGPPPPPPAPTPSGGRLNDADSLWVAVREGDVARARDLLSRWRASRSIEAELASPASDESPLGGLPALCHPLCRCAKCEAALAAARLARLGDAETAASVEQRNERNWTPLHCAAFYGHLEVVQLLLDSGADPCALDFSGATGLHLAAMNGHHEVCLLLLHSGCDLSLLDCEGMAPLHYGADRGSLEVAQALAFNPSCNVSIRTAVTEDTPLHMAARWSYRQIVAFLVSCGADPRTVNRRGQAPSGVAASPHVVELLATAAANAAANSRRPKAASQAAATPTVAKKPEAERPPRPPSPAPVQPKQPTSPRRPSSLSSSRMSAPPQSEPAGLQQQQQRVEKMLRAAADGDIQLVRHYLGLPPGGADNEADEDVDADLDGASSATATEATEEAVAPSPSSLCHPLCQCHRCAPLQTAAAASSPFDASGRSSAAPAPPALTVNSASSDGFTLLHVAAIHGHTRLAGFALDRRAAPDCRTRAGGFTPVHFACQHSRPQALRFLLHRGCDPAARDNQGNTPLHLCAMKGHVDCASVILETGPAWLVNSVNGRGNSPLHEAARGCYPAMCDLLLRHGATPDQRNRQQLAPYQLTGDPQVLGMLRRRPEAAPASPTLRAQLAGAAAAADLETEARSSSGVGPSPPSSLLDFTLTPSSSLLTDQPLPPPRSQDDESSVSGNAEDDGDANGDEDGGEKRRSAAELCRPRPADYKLTFSSDCDS
uniref:VPS9 domain-containing protein n=1 Tax=Macrostomum lignano TaxID=282301 RepID=A0A1I8IXX6_9PLAT